MIPVFLADLNHILFRSGPGLTGDRRRIVLTVALGTTAFVDRYRILEKQGAAIL